MSAADQRSSSEDQFRADLDRTFRAPLTAFFLSRVRDRSEAEDLTQEVFVRILHHASDIDPGRAKSYVFTAAANLLRDRSRRAAVRQTQALATSDGSEPVSPELVEEISPERVLLGRQTLAGVLAALEGLPHRTRDIFVLYRIEHMKQHEIASLLGLSHGSVENHLVKAMTYLTERFERP